MSSLEQAVTLKLTVTDCRPGFTGYARGGREYTIYDIAALLEDGSPWEGKRLRSFEQLPLGELREYEAVPYVKHGEVKNYTLKPK
jgi:hypothetical protein